MHTLLVEMLLLYDPMELYIHTAIRAVLLHLVVSFLPAA